MNRDEADRELDRLRALTDAIEPEPRISEAIMAAVRASATEDPLAEIARRTSSMDAGAGFADAVVERARASEKGDSSAPSGHRSVQRASRARGSWLDGVARSGPIAIGLAAVAAAASVLMFLSSERDDSAEIASSVDLVEIIE